MNLNDFIVNPLADAKQMPACMLAYIFLPLELWIHNFLPLSNGLTSVSCSSGSKRNETGPDCTPHPGERGCVGTHLSL